MRIWTCTPRSYTGTPAFFSRDSGLLCRGLQSVGVESRAVMPGAPRPDDEPDLIRTEYRNLESEDWWKKQQLDGVVLYAWGRPKFRKVAAAIRGAGIFLILNQDSAGLMTPRAGFGDWFRAQWIYGGEGRSMASWLRFLIMTIRGMTVEFFLSDSLRGAHLRQGDVISCVTPAAVERYRKLCHAYGGGTLAGKVRLLPHAVESFFHYTKTPRLRQVVCVGRWHDCTAKRAWRLQDTADRLLRLDHKVTIVIAGETTPGMRHWHASLDSSRNQRVKLMGRMGRNGLRDVLRESQVFYCPSSSESFCIAAAEALCCGCSVVAARKITLPGFMWFVSEDSGRLSKQDDARSHADALLDELASWEHGERDAAAISRVWCDWLHADKVATKVVEQINSRS